MAANLLSFDFIRVGFLLSSWRIWLFLWAYALTVVETLSAGTARLSAASVGLSGLLKTPRITCLSRKMFCAAPFIQS